MEGKTKTLKLSGGLFPLKRDVANQETMAPNNMNDRDRIIARVRQERDMSKVRIIPAKPELGLVDLYTRKRVCVYCRVSTDGLSQVTSFELQKKYYLKMVRQKPEWKLVAMYSDEGLSATGTKKRIGLLTMLDDARTGKIDIIVVKNLSRLSRNLMDCMNIIYELRQLPHPVGILFENEGLFTLDKTADFTLQVLSLVAQEESHKKSEAMNGSYKARFSQGDYMKPALLGYDRVDVNQIAVNEEEAKTVQLIFMMYLASIPLETIADVLTMLGRKTHTHKYKDGRIKEGVVKWTANSVKNVLTNERRCGDVRAQKTYTIDYLTHKTRKNDKVLQQFYAVDQHQAIIDHEDFYLTQRILHANRGGWKYGLPSMELVTSGKLEGFISTVPNWQGFSAEDYNRASLAANGMTEQELNEIQNRITAQFGQTEEEETGQHEFQHQYAIDSDDYDLFPDSDVEPSAGQDEEPTESFRTWVDSLREKSAQMKANKRMVSGYNLESCELIRPQYFSIRDKVHVTMDRKGMTFNKQCYRVLAEKKIEDIVELFYSPVERLVVVRPAREKTTKVLNWIKESNGKILMKRCSCRGLATAIFENMGWHMDYKYRILGNVIPDDEGAMLVFNLNEPIILVPAKEEQVKDIDTDELTEQQTKRIIRDGYIPPEKNFIPNLDGFDLGDGPMADAARKMSRSRVMYYDDLTDHVKGAIYVADLGNRRFQPECIRQLLQKGLAPEEGWYYLRGMAVLRNGSFSIFPEEWADDFGKTIYQSDCVKEKMMFGGSGRVEDRIEYGWTVGLDVPTKETVRCAIDMLRRENAG